MKKTQYNSIPKKLKIQIGQDPFMTRCIYASCTNQPEWEHAFIYARKRIQEAWAIVPVCTYHHREQGLNKEFNQFHAINRATDEDFAKYPRKDWQQINNYLNSKYIKKSK